VNSKHVALIVLLSFSLLAQRRIGQSNITVPVPSDPHELVTGQVGIPSAGERGTDMELLQRALQNSRLMNPSMGPSRIDVTFTASGAGGASGQGQFTQTWLSPRAWRWSATLGATTVVRGTTSQGSYADSASPVPMPVHLLRNAIFSAMYDLAIGTQLRSAPATLNGKPVTCLLTSGVVGAPSYQGRLWEELEYCFDNQSGLLVSSSFAPGVFTVYSYAKNLTLRGHTLPDHLSMYEGGSQVLDATLELSDAAGTDPGALAPGPGMVARASVLTSPARQPFSFPAPAGVTKISPVIVHANVVDGDIIDAQVCASSDPALASTALDTIKAMRVGVAGQQQVYLNIKFVPPQN
jgi:hypothetical protein